MVPSIHILKEHSRRKKANTITNISKEKITRKYYKQFYANKLHTLDEMDKFLEKQIQADLILLHFLVLQRYYFLFNFFILNGRFVAALHQQVC